MRIKCPRCQQVVELQTPPGDGVVPCSSCGAKLRLPARPATKPSPSSPPPASGRPRPDEPDRPRPSTRTPANEEIPWAAPAEGVRNRPSRPSREERDELPAALPAGRRSAARRSEEEELEELDGAQLEVLEDEPKRSSRRPARFKVKPYQVDGGINPLGVPLVLGLEVFVGLVLGVLFGIVGQFFYLILLFPIVIGLGVGVVGVLGVWVGKVRNPLVTGMAGLMGGFIAILTMHFCNYLFSESETNEPPPIVRPAQARLRPGMGQPPVPPTREAKQVGFFTYIDQEATRGVSIGRGGSPSSSFNLGYVGTYIYWFVELLVVAGLAFLCVAGAAAAPFCRHCNTWKKQHKLGTVENTPEEAKEAVEAGGLRELMPVEEDEEEPESVRIQVHVCPNCRADAPVEVQVQKVTKKSKSEESTDDLVQMTYPGEALATLERMFPDADLGKPQKRSARKRRDDEDEEEDEPRRETARRRRRVEEGDE